MIHNLSHPINNSVNDFIDSEFCTVRYSSIDGIRCSENGSASVKRMENLPKPT